MELNVFGIALKMLFADRAKLFGLLFGVAFATLLITQQSSFFIGLMLRTQSLIADAQEVDLWVMDPSVEHIDSLKAMRDVEVQRVRGVPGVAWAVPFFRATTAVRTKEGRNLVVTVSVSTIRR
jgi:putative ABC transport system permease protein